MPQKVVTQSPCRLSYPALFQPRAPKDGQGDPKYQALLLIPKSDTTTVNAMLTAIQTEMAEAAAPAGKWGGRAPAQPTISFYDGDLPNPRSGESWGEECRGYYLLRASSARQPDVVDEFGQKVLDATKFYAGCWCYFSINFAAYDSNGNKGVGAYLNCVMFARDDEALDGHASAKEDFANLIAAKSPAPPIMPASVMTTSMPAPAMPASVMPAPPATPQTPVWPAQPYAAPNGWRP